MSGRNPWTPEEDERLRKLWLSGAGVKQFDIPGRTFHGIRERIARLRRQNPADWSKRAGDACEVFTISMPGALRRALREEASARKMPFSTLVAEKLRSTF